MTYDKQNNNVSRLDTKYINGERNSSYKDILKKDYEELFKTTTILDDDYKDIFNEYNDKHNFVFLDPPFDDCVRDYVGKFGQQAQIDLSEIFKTTKNKCLLILNDTPFMNLLYKDYIKEKYDVTYCNNLNKTNKKIKHMIITNY